MQRFLRQRAVIELTGLPRSTLYDLMAQGLFPKPVKIAPRAVAWPAQEIETWAAERIAERDSKHAA